MKNAPSRDTIILWSAVITVIGLLALLVRHAAIYRFGTDTFTGNVLFGVIFILLVGLYLGFQSVIEYFSRTICNRQSDYTPEQAKAFTTHQSTVLARLMPRDTSSTHSANREWEVGKQSRYDHIDNQQSGSQLAM